MPETYTTLLAHRHQARGRLSGLDQSSEAVVAEVELDLHQTVEEGQAARGIDINVCDRSRACSGLSRERPFPERRRRLL